MLLLAGALACGGRAATPAASLSPVPVDGSRHSVRALAGRWHGVFENTVARRTGTIVFVLDADRQTGAGSVSLPGTAVIPIGRLVADEGSVAGWLESYRDPERGCVLETWFEGVTQGDTIRGLFFALPSVGDTIQMGPWWATRVP